MHLEPLTLRPYQIKVLDALREALNGGMRAPCASVATGGGKSRLVAAIAASMVAKGHHVAALTHSRELIRQLEKTAKLILPEDQVGVIAAGLGRRDPPRKLQICQIQSVGRRPDQIGPRRIVIIDELQAVNHEQGQYLRTIEALRVKTPDMRLIGLSATPFRTTSGLCYGPGRIFDDCVVRVGMRELIADGFLCPIIGKTGDKDFKVEGVHMRGGDFKPDELENYMADKGKVDRAVADFVPRLAGRRQVLVFSTGLKHNAMIAESIRRYDPAVGCIDGEMANGERDRVLARFESGDIRYLINCAILTTGYDSTGIDGIVMLRPTRSPGLLIQCAGRGLRLDPRKAECAFLDYGGCLQYFGPLDQIEENITAKKKGPPGQAPTKVCPTCDTVVHASAMLCPTCGYVWERRLNHEEKVADAPVMSDTPIEYQIKALSVRRHQKKDKPVTLRIDYCDQLGMPVASEWLSISPEADPYAVSKSMKTLEKWPESPFKRVGDTLYKLHTSGQLMALDVDGIIETAARLKAPTTITTIRDGKYVRVTKKEFAP